MRLTRIAAVTLVLAALVAPAFAGGVEEGKRLAKDGRHADAAAAFREALKASPTNREAILGLARAAADGRLGGEAYGEVEGRLRGLFKDKEDREARIALGYVFLAWIAEDERYRADADDQFRRLLRADPADDEAAVGLARMYYAGADYDNGLKTLDEVLAKKPGSGLALYWKGELLYDRATQAFGRVKTVDDDVRGMFEKALGAYEASTKADPARFDAWMKTGYCAQYLAGVDPSKQAVAQAAYEKAIDLDGESQLPLKGLAALHRSKPEAWVEALTRLVKEKPKAPAVTYWWAYQLRSSGKTEEAEKAYRAFAAASRFPALGWYEIGTLLAEKGDAPGAKKAFERSLELDPKHVRAGAAVDALVAALNGRAQEAVRDGVKAKALLRDYEALANLVPWSSGVRNDAGFFAREAFNETKDPAILQASVKWYVAASALIPELREDLVESTPYPTRHGWAQILNDTGLMFQYYDATRDLGKAEAYYRKAMEWTQHGYWDAYGNLMKILKAASRWQDAFDFATACADGIKKENGEPNESFRGTCRGEAEMLAKKLEGGK